MKKSQYTGDGRKGQATKEEFRNIAWACRDGVRKAKAQLELILARDTKGNKESYHYINSKKQNRENVGPLLNEVGDLVTADTDTAEVLNVIFASGFTNKVPQASLETEFKENSQQWMRVDSGIT